MQAVILAAGESSRFWPLNQKHKSLLKIMGRPLIWWTIEGLKKQGIKDIIVVQGPKRDIEEELKNYGFTGLKIRYVIQPKPKGMGNALWLVRNLLKGSFLALNAERVDVEQIIKKIKQYNGLVRGTVLAGQKTNQPSLFGIMKLRGDKVLDIIEKPSQKTSSGVRVVGVYSLEPEFFKYYQKVKKHQYDFEDALSFYARERDVRAVIIDKEVSSLKYPWDSLKINKILMDKYLKKDEVKMGKNVKVFENAIIRGPAYIGDDCIIGNNALIREYTDLEKGVVVGANAELARCVFQEGVHVHSGYFGDSILGRGCRVGAGAITANVRLDRGKIKETNLDSLGVIVGENSKIGINCSLMPGVLMGSDSVVGPNSLVFDNIEDKTIFYTQFKNITEKRKPS